MVKNRAKGITLNTLPGVMKLTFKVSHCLTINIAIARVISLLTETSLKIACEMPAGRQLLRKYVVKHFNCRSVYVFDRNRKLELSAEGFQNVLDNPTLQPFIVIKIMHLLLKLAHFASGEPFRRDWRSFRPAAVLKPGEKAVFWSKIEQYGKEIDSLLDCVSKLMFSVFKRCSTSHNLMNLVTSGDEFAKVILKR